MPIEPAEEFVFLRHAPCVTLSKERLIELRLRGSVREPPEPQWLGAPSRAWALASAGVREGAKDRVQASVD